MFKRLIHNHQTLGNDQPRKIFMMPTRLSIRPLILLIALAIGAGAAIAWGVHAWKIRHLREIVLSNSDHEKYPLPVQPQQHESKSASSTNVLVEVVPDAKEEARIRTGREIIRNLMSELDGTGEGTVVNRITRAHLHKLEALGEDGSKAIWEFLKTREDINLGSHLQIGENRETSFYPSVRNALIEALFDMDNPTSRTASLEVLQSTTSDTEVFLAIRNLEKFSPGTYREDALHAVKQIIKQWADGNFQKKMSDGSAQSDSTAFLDPCILEVVGHYQIREMIPQIEKLILKEPNLIGQWVTVLDEFGVNDQVDFLRKMINNPEGRKNFFSIETIALAQLDFQNEKVCQLVRETMSSASTFMGQMTILNAIGASPYSNLIKSERANRIKSMSSGENIQSLEFQKDKAESALRLLNELEPNLNEPKAREYLARTQESLRGVLKFVSDRIQEDLQEPTSQR